jgi:N-acetylglutamate synthase-like GNAT family acetyltransferase
VAEFTYRQAGLDDAADIHALLLALAPEIPVLITRLEDEERLYALVRNCARSGESWVACDAAGRIVGFVLVEPAQLRRHYAEGEALELRYAGVAPDCRKQSVFSELVQQVLARMLPVATSVNPQNRSGIAARLEQSGFRQTGAAGGELRLRWDPGAGRNPTCDPGPHRP